jgi:hypothetical protein
MSSVIVWFDVLLFCDHAVQATVVNTSPDFELFLIMVNYQKHFISINYSFNIKLQYVSFAIN